MDRKSYWVDYCERINLGIQLPSSSGHLTEIVKTNLLPAIFSQWCKGNVNNGKVLFTSLIRELLSTNKLNFSLSTNLQNKIIPIDCAGQGDFRKGAKTLLSEMKSHAENLDEVPVFELFGILISDLNPEQKTKYPISFFLSPDLTSVTVSYKRELEAFSLALLSNLINSIDSSEQSNATIEFIELGHELLRKELSQAEIRKVLISKAWDSVFEHKIDFGKNYYANGGDSIQAIRFLSKLKQHGAGVDLAGLIHAFSLSQWTFDILEKEKEHIDFTSDPAAFPLTEMQKKIWSHSQTFKEHGAYHEQFLFELTLTPSIAEIELCINAIWKSYPNIRINVNANGTQLNQLSSETRLSVVESHFNTIEDALIEDRAEPFEDSLLRLKILSIGNTSYLLWSHHHIILDGWSVGILIQEFIERLTTKNFEANTHRNYQYQLHQFEKEFPALQQKNEVNPFIIPINEYNLENSFKSIHFSHLSIDPTKEMERIRDFQITKQLFYCGITGVILRSICNENHFYFNGISSGRDFLEGEIDQAVGLFIRNIQIPILLDETTTWHSYYHRLNANFQEVLSTKNRKEPFGNTVTKSDFLFVYENYPYTDLKSDAIEAELVHVTEITGYPITFCLFPNSDGYALRIVYDARRFNEQFIIGLKIKFEETCNYILNEPSDSSIILNKAFEVQKPNVLAIDTITKDVLDEISDLNMNIEMIEGPHWNQLFDHSSFSQEQINFDGIEFWSNQLYNTIQGEWNDAYSKEKKLELTQSISSKKDPFSTLIAFIKYLKLAIWDKTEFQVNVQRANVIFPLIIHAFEHEDELIQLIQKQVRNAELYAPEYTDLFQKHWSPKSNFLVAMDDSISIENCPHFDLVLICQDHKVEIHSNQTISSSFTDTFIQYLSEQASIQLNDNLSCLSTIQNVNFDTTQSFINLFDVQVQRTPNQLAVDDGKQKLTYLELDQYSNPLARYLYSNYQLDHLNFVGLRLKRNRNQLACVLALIKLGKAFVPLDINWPDFRVNQIVEQAQLNLIIDDKVLEGIQLEFISNDSIKTEEKSIHSAFYALFTSGSTGIPKGCVISEFSFLNYLAHCKTSYFDQSDNSTLHIFTPLTFDFTLTSFLGGLAFGCSLILHSEEENVYDSIKIALDDDKSSVLKLTPSHISLAEKEWFSKSNYKTIIVGGEALTDFQISKCIDGNNHRLINEYGPTEATIGCVYYEIKATKLPFIGLPINGMGVLVLNEENEIVTKGTVGELCLFGNGLADGYLNDQFRTHQVFQEWNKHQTHRIYRTGDLVKMQHDGNLMFLSRKDGQVKLNGYRIETNEITTALQEICGRNSHSIVIETESSKQLISFLEGKKQTRNIVEELKKRLPAYMVPSKIIELAKLPITSNGKLDEQQLKNLYLRKNTLEREEKNEIDSIERILKRWRDLDPQLKTTLSWSTIKSKSWSHFQKQIHFLQQINTSDLTILTSQSVRSTLPKYFSTISHASVNFEKGKPHLICNGRTFSFDDLSDYGQQLKNLGIKLPENGFSLFSNTINSLFELTDLDLPKEIESKNISFLCINQKAMVRDWSNIFGFPFIVYKNSTGELICIMPTDFKNEITDSFGFNQPEEWEGNSAALASEKFNFKYSKGQLLLVRRETIVRFSQCIYLSFLEKLAHKIDGEIECAYAVESDNRILIYLQSQKELDIVEFEQRLTQELPSWLQIEKVLSSKNISQLISNDEGVNTVAKSSSFTEFLELNLPEYAYLNGAQSLIEQGGDSITALRIVGKLKNKGYQIEVGALLNAENISDYLLTLKSDFSKKIDSHEKQLTPIQEWFIEAYPGNKNHFNQSILLELQLDIESALLLSALETTLENHSILSNVFVNHWKDGLKPRIEFIQCETEDAVTNFCSEIQESFDITTGPVAGGGIIAFQNKLLLFISIHHLYCDGFTWRIILDDVQEVLQGRGFKRESAGVYGKIRNQFLEICTKTKSETIEFYGDNIQNPFTNLSSFSFKDSNYIEWEWSIEETKWFLYSQEIGNTANEKFLYLFLSTWLELGYAPSTVFFETHGRFYEGIPELTETIGWFTQFYPLFSTNWPNLENLKVEISRQFEILPENGLTYMGNDHWYKPPFPILLNYLGNFDENRGSIAIPSSISQGNMTSVDNPTLSIVELNALIIEGKMKWMLRMHPELNPSAFKIQLNNNIIQLMDYNKNSNYIAQSIDQDDLDAINNLLGGV